MQVKNINIVSMHAMIRKIDHEIRNAVSAGISHMRSPDIARAKTYLDELEAYHEFLVGQDPVDWPHAADVTTTLEPLAPTPDTENTSVKELLSWLKIVEAELTKSQSKDLPAGLVSFDSERLDANIAYARGLISFVEDATPTDRPESAASEAQ